MKYLIKVILVLLQLKQVISILSFEAIIVVMLNLGCKGWEAEIPAYLHVDSVVTFAASGEGSNSHIITDAWVFLENNSIGVYELHRTFPVIAEGYQKVTIKAGIKKSGISASRINYPFFNSYTDTVLFSPDSVISIIPEFKYADWVEFALIEDFEGVSEITSFEETAASDTLFYITNEPSEVFEGNASGVVYLDDKNTFFEFTTAETYNLVKSGNPVYVELNYKTEAEIYVGVYGFVSGVQYQVYPSIIIRDNQEWNKIYVSLTDEVSTQLSADEFKVYIAGLNVDSLSSATVFLDNIKILYQPL